MRLGEKALNAPEMEEAAAVLLRYGRAAQEGAARLVAELIPVPFVDIAELTATEDAVVRTGFLAGTDTYGGTIYKPTRAFERLSALVPLEAALEVEHA